MPQYVGSDQRSSGALPIPYFVYRGESLRISRESLSGRLFKRADLVVDLSADFGLPVNSEDNRARAGMDDIDFTAEVGPALRYIFLRNTGNHRTMSIEIPLRAVFQSNLRYVDHVGWRLNPRLRYREHFGRWQLSAWGGVYWNDRRYNQLFYAVDAKDATSSRAQYATRNGYGGWAASASLSYRHRNWWLGGFVRWYDIRRATFADSPLAREPYSVGVGLAASWIFKVSDRRVPGWN